MNAGRFEFISGSRCLDFVDTLGNRLAEPVERLAAPGDLDLWLGAAGLADSIRIKSTAGDLVGARALREAIFRFAMSAVEDAAPGSRDIQTINWWAQRMPLRPRIAGARVQMTAKQPVEAVLSSIAADFEITQLVDGKKGVHGMIAKAIFK